MKFLLTIVAFCLAGIKVQAQKPVYDSIAFHLYTDSLKRNVHNYINVDGRLPGAGWLPLTKDQIVFSSAQGRFEGNSLIIDNNFKGDSVVITATDKRNQKLSQTITIYIKTVPDNEQLKTVDEVINGKRDENPPRRRKRRRD